MEGKVTREEVISHYFIFAKPKVICTLSSTDSFSYLSSKHLSLALGLRLNLGMLYSIADSNCCGNCFCQDSTLLRLAQYLHGFRTSLVPGILLELKLQK